MSKGQYRPDDPTLLPGELFIPRVDENGNMQVAIISGGGGAGGGDASAANQVTGNNSLSSIDSKTPALVSGRQPVDGSGVIQPVSGTVNAAAPVWTPTATGAITAAATGTIKNSSGRLRAVRVLYAGTGTNYFQLHNKLTATGFSDSTLLGFGYDLIAVTNPLFVLDFEEELVFSTGICWAISSTQATYTSVAQNAYVFAEYI